MKKSIRIQIHVIKQVSFATSFNKPNNNQGQNNNNGNLFNRQLQANINQPNNINNQVLNNNNGNFANQTDKSKLVYQKVPGPNITKTSGINQIPYKKN